MRRALLTQLLVLAALPASAVAASGTADFEQRVATAQLDGAASAATAHGWVASAAQRAPARFDLLGVTAGAGVRPAQLRVRRHGRWSRWVQAHAGEPVWTGPARIYQLRTAGPARALRLHFVAVRRPASAPLASPAAAGGRPRIVPRAVWDPGNVCAPRTTPSYGRMDLGFVHHTVSLNGYGPGDAAAMVLGICLFHRNGNGWNDIGYNLLVDRYGTVFEGRAGGVDQPVIGAHAQGWNGVSTGIAAIGDFGGAGAPAPLVHALARVLAWKLGLAGLPATGSVGEVSIGGELNRWPEDADVRFQRISGHRDGGFTDCPGGALYAQLPALRAEVARLLPAPRDLLTIGPAPDVQPAGEPVLLTGRLARADGRRPVGVDVVLQQQQAGAWVDVATVATGADGIWSAELPLAQSGDVRAVATASGIVSPAVPIQVEAGVRARISSRQARLGTAIELTGATAPPKPRVRVLVERRLSEGDDPRPRFRRVTVRTLPVAADGRYVAPLRLPAAGIYRVTVRTPTDRANAAGRSRALTVRVLPAR